LLLVANASAHAACAILGEYWQNAPTSANDASIVPTNAPDAQFYPAEINFDSRIGAGKKGIGPGYTVAGFLHYPVFFNTSAGFQPNGYIDGSFFRFTGQVYLNAGTNNFVVTHDDGLILFITGIGLVVNQPGPTAPVNTPFIAVAPSNGLYAFTLHYGETKGAPGVLIWTNNGAAVGSYLCPPNVVVPANSGCTATNVPLGTPSGAFACGNVTMTNNAPPNLTFPVGTNSVTWTFYDTNGNSSSCLQQVVVLGGSGPIITCPADIVVSAGTGLCWIPSSQVFLDSPGVIDCLSFSVSNNVPANFLVGTNIVTWTASDVGGKSSSCQQRVIVLDTQPPTIGCPPDVTVNASPGQCYATGVALGSPLVSDNCAITGISSNAPAQFPVGTNLVTWVVTDTSGNTNFCQQRVIVRDTQPPIINCPANITVNASPGQCSSNVAFTVTATDNCAGTPMVVSAPLSGSSFPVGTTLVTCTATDASGNTNSCTFTVTVRDNQPPTIVCPSNITVSAGAGRCSSNVTFTVAATDLCGPVSSLTSTPPSGSAFAVGTTLVTSVAMDASGNTNSCTFTVTVRDDQPPMILCPADVSVRSDPGTNVATNVSLGSPTVSDNCGIAAASSNAPSFYPLGTNLVTWTATDTSGNSNTCLQRVVVTSSAPPQIACPATVTVNADAGSCSASGVSLGTPALTSPGCGGVTLSNNAPPLFALGTNVVTWTATDACGKSGFCQQRVIVVDNQPPTITCSSNLTLATDPGGCSRSNVTYTVGSGDNCSWTLFQTAGLPSGASFPKGVTTNVFTVTDSSGNGASCFFTVTVLDAQPPAIACPANVTVIANAGSSATNVYLGTPVTSDNCGVLVVTNNAPASLPAGTNIVTWTVTDTSGNTNSCQQTVVVVPGPPQIACPPDITTNTTAGLCSATGINLSTPVITSPGCGAVVVTSNAPAQFPPGMTTVIWAVTDRCGNQALCSQRVTVHDTQAPAILCSSNMVLTTDPGRCSRSNVTYTVTSSDNCPGSLLSRLSGFASGSTFPKGTTTNSFRITDASGNANSCSFTVTVIDNEPPQITCPPALTVSTQPGQTTATNVSLGAPVVSDNCGVASLSNNAPASFPAGTNFVTWTVTDTSGNTSSCQQKVIVNQICFGQLYASPLADQTVCPCGYASFETTVGSPDPVTFTWRHNGQLIGGATNNTLFLYSLKTADAGSYTVEVRTPCNSVIEGANLRLLNTIGSNPATFLSTNSIDIVDDSDANPYPSVINVQCLPGRVQSVTVTLNGFEHAFPSDVGVLLAAPDGTGITLMSDAGGSYSISGTVLTFSAAATNFVPEYDMITNGVYLPSDYNPGEFGSLATVTNLSSFQGIDPNGAWGLYVLDDTFGDAGSIVSWTLQLQWQTNIPVLLNPQMLSNGVFQAEVHGLAGYSYLVQGSTDLKTWVPLATNAIASDPTLFIDTHSPQFPYRFYRVSPCP
jgi:subtilisin-like proprotein convertase family protein